MSEKEKCPCHENCCDNPDIGSMEQTHECSEDCYHDEHWCIECRNCGATCGCNV